MRAALVRPCCKMAACPASGYCTPETRFRGQITVSYDTDDGAAHSTGKPVAGTSCLAAVWYAHATPSATMQYLFTHAVHTLQ